MKFRVIIQQVLLTEVTVDAVSPADARRQIKEYGIGPAAMDMATYDQKTERIKAVLPA
jgi:hypothetical protein